MHYIYKRINIQVYMYIMLVHIYIIIMAPMHGWTISISSAESMMSQRMRSCEPGRSSVRPPAVILRGRPATANDHPQLHISYLLFLFYSPPMQHLPRNSHSSSSPKTEERILRRGRSQFCLRVCVFVRLPLSESVYRRRCL